MVNIWNKIWLFPKSLQDDNHFSNEAYLFFTWVLTATKIFLCQKCYICYYIHLFLTTSMRLQLLNESKNFCTILQNAVESVLKTEATQSNKTTDLEHQMWNKKTLNCMVTAFQSFFLSQSESKIFEDLKKTWNSSNASKLVLQKSFWFTSWENCVANCLARIFLIAIHKWLELQ